MSSSQVKQADIMHQQTFGTVTRLNLFPTDLSLRIKNNNEQLSNEKRKGLKEGQFSMQSSKLAIDLVL